MIGKWEPGPWEVFKNDSLTHVVGPRLCRKGNSSGDIKLCHRWVLGAWKYDKQAHANMHLIAAAPELYEALNGLLKVFVEDLAECGYDEDDIADHDLVKAARAALAKARGETR